MENKEKVKEKKKVDVKTLKMQGISSSAKLKDIKA
jgi:hypothetical protein